MTLAHPQPIQPIKRPPTTTTPSSGSGSTAKGSPTPRCRSKAAYPATKTISMEVSETLRIRFIGSNTVDIHPMHIHGGPFTVVARDGEALTEDQYFEADTVNIGPGQRYDGIWEALEPGQWLIHCHTITNNVIINVTE